MKEAFITEGKVTFSTNTVGPRMVGSAHSAHGLKLRREGAGAAELPVAAVSAVVVAAVGAAFAAAFAAAAAA